MRHNFAQSLEMRSSEAHLYMTNRLICTARTYLSNMNKKELGDPVGKKFLDFTSYPSGQAFYNFLSL